MLKLYQPRHQIYGTVHQTFPGFEPCSGAPDKHPTRSKAAEQPDVTGHIVQTHTTHTHRSTTPSLHHRRHHGLKRRKGGTCRTLAPTLFLQPDDLGVGAKAVPRRAVVDGLEVGRHDVAHGQCGDHAFLRGHRLHGVAAGRPGLQHRLLPRPGLRGGGTGSGVFGERRHTGPTHGKNHVNNTDEFPHGSRRCCVRRAGLRVNAESCGGKREEGRRVDV